MTITRRWQAGLETGDISEFTGVGLSSDLPTASSTTPKSGTYKLLIYSNNGSGSTAFVSIASTAQIRSGFFWNPASCNQADEMDIFSVKNSGGTKLLSLQFTGSGGGNNLIIDVAGTNKDTEPNASAGNAYIHIGVDIKVHASAGWVVVYKDGVEILRFEGNTGNTNITDVFFGASGAIGVQQSMDDLYIDDTTGEAAAAVCPILQFYPVIANGDGNYSQFTGSDGNSVNNSLLVDETPPNGDTDFVQATSADKLDSYAMTTYTLLANQVCKAIIPYVSAKRAGSTEQIALGTRYSATDVIGADQNPPTAYDYLWERQTTKPGGGSWDQTAIDGFEAVIKSRGTY